MERFSSACSLLLLLLYYYIIIIIIITRADRHTKWKKINEVGVCQRLVCQKREFAVRSSSCEVNDPKLTNEIFVRIDMKHSYFSNYLFAINFFLLLKLLLFAKN